MELVQFSVLTLNFLPIMIYGMVNIGLGNGLLPYATEP